MRRASTLAFLLLAVAACKRPDPQAQQAQAAAQPSSPGAPVMRGKVLERIDVPQYSYLKLQTASGETWAAVQRTDKKAGDEVAVGNVLAMPNFYSKELDRKFEVVYFGTLAGPAGQVPPLPAAPAGVTDAAAGGLGPAAKDGLPPGHPPMQPGGMGAKGAQGAQGGEGEPTQASMAAQHQTAATGPKDVKVEKVPKAPGSEGRTVEEVWTQRSKLAGKPVAVRGQVVKAMPVMGRNFVHVRDGSGDAAKGENDLTVTTDDAVKVGDVVTLKGVVVTDKDFGSGYTYPVMLEGAKLGK